MSTHYRPGDVVVYRKQKCSVHPGCYARDIEPVPNGDDYIYCVEKYWRVVAVRPDDTVVVQTRKGKEHTIAPGDPNVRRTTWWEWLFQRHRFPPRAADIEQDAGPVSQS